MCGLSVILNPEGVEGTDLFNMNDIIKHRGPDDEGFYLESDDGESLVMGGEDTPIETYKGKLPYSPTSKHNYHHKFNVTQVGLGHRRLSIIDLSPKGHQPLSDTTGRYWIVYNGEIYNYAELRAELKTLGHQFFTETDTEVIINSYIQWGIDCQHKFNGMWSFALYDKLEKTIFLSRDRFGIKPLYYWISPLQTFHAASEIKQFTTCKGWVAFANTDRVHDYIYHCLTDHTDETMFSGVYQIAPGHYFFGNIKEACQAHGSRVSITKWYDHQVQNFTGSFEEACKTFSDTFKSAIELHLRSDVTNGSALSGGLDSSAIVCYSNQLLKNQGSQELQKTFSSCSTDERYDERKWMEEVVKTTKLESHFIYPEGKDVFKLSEKILWHLDEPYQSQSVFLGYHVFQEAKKNGVKVMLNGQGADEYLFAYGEYRKLRWRRGLLKLNFKEVLNEAQQLGYPKGSFFFMQLFSNLIPTWLRVYMVKLSSRNKRMSTIVNNQVLPPPKKHLYEIDNYHKRNVQEVSKHQMAVEPLPKYLRFEDRISMAHSIEARVPFLDYRLVEFTRSLPIEYLDGPNEPKKIIANALSQILPEAIRKRKDKKGFITPEQKWFMEDFKQEFLNLLKENVHFAKGIIRPKEAIDFYSDMQTGKIKFSYQYWHLVQICIWMKIFNVKIKNSKVFDTNLEVSTLQTSLKAFSDLIFSFFPKSKSFGI